MARGHIGDYIWGMATLTWAMAQGLRGAAYVDNIWAVTRSGPARC